MNSSDLKTRLRKDRPTTTIRLRMPSDVLEDLLRLAPRLRMRDAHAIIRFYVGQGLRAAAYNDAIGGTRSRTRTGTEVALQRILNPRRLPVPPPGPVRQRIMPPRVLAAFPKQFAVVLAQVLQERLPPHTAIRSSW